MKIEISRKQYNTIMYWAHRGAAESHKYYTDKFPLRKSPYEKVAAIEKHIRAQGLYRK